MEDENMLIVSSRREWDESSIRHWITGTEGPSPKHFFLNRMSVTNIESDGENKMLPCQSGNRLLISNLRCTLTPKFTLTMNPVCDLQLGFCKVFSLNPQDCAY
ncbi:hypothetical protein TNIN_220141 [Trichonephila inaurata madagascariensis]|uniref:Uncharacterized protein n=1 Tax=Trichonephila inaurata madagascariensis TaxID=2747483 RepID=A0A8X7CDC5_9ARAC|nr:hypothetical protein TNIN_220141 [Trichonephila inaurata madagascariensis]